MMTMKQSTFSGELLSEWDKDVISGKKIRCVICGKAFEQLSGHLSISHGLSVDEYIDKYPGEPVVSPKLHDVMVQCNYEKHSVPGYSKGLGEKARKTLFANGGAKKVAIAKKIYHFNKRWNNIVDSFIIGKPIYDFTEGKHWDVELDNWRSEVYRRDCWTCQICYNKGCKINAHHIKMFSKRPDLMYDVANGITLCRDCHMETFGKEEIYEDFLYKRINNDYKYSINKW